MALEKKTFRGLRPLFNFLNERYNTDIDLERTIISTQVIIRTKSGKEVSCGATVNFKRVLQRLSEGLDLGLKLEDFSKAGNMYSVMVSVSEGEDVKIESPAPVTEEVDKVEEDQPEEKPKTRGRRKTATKAKSDEAE